MQRERRQRRGNPEITAVSEQRKEKPLMKIASRRRRRKAEIMKQTGRWVLVSDEGLKGEAMKGTDNEGEKLE